MKARQFRERQAARIAGNAVTQEMETDNNEYKERPGNYMTEGKRVPPRRFRAYTFRDAILDIAV